MQFVLVPGSDWDHYVRMSGDKLEREAWDIIDNLRSMRLDNFEKITLTGDCTASERTSLSDSDEVDERLEEVSKSDPPSFFSDSDSGDGA